MQIQGVFNDYSRTKINIFKAKSNMVIGAFTVYAWIHKVTLFGKSQVYLYCVVKTFFG